MCIVETMDSGNWTGQWTLSSGHLTLDTGQVIFVARIYAIAQSKLFLDEGMEAGEGRTQIRKTLSKVASSATLLFW